MITAKDIVGKSFLPHFEVIVRKEDDEFLDDPRKRKSIL